MKPRLPLQPQLVFSGSSYYTVEAVYGKIAGQRDVWDAVQDNSSPSVSAALLSCFHELCGLTIMLLPVLA